MNNSLNSDYNVLTWHTRDRDQERLKWWFYGNVPCIHTPRDILPAFQIVKSRTGNLPSRFVVKDLNSFETDVLSQMTATGLQVLQPAGVNYDIVMYLGSLMLTGFSFDDRVYYLEMDIDGNTWYSETFKFIQDNQLQNYILLEWCHNGNFLYPNGHIQYTKEATGTGNGFRNRLWLRTSLGKPGYPVDEDLEQRGGRTFPTLQISSKEYRMVFQATETLLDAMRVINQHHIVRIYVGETWYDIDRFLFNQEWLERGDIAEVTASIFLDTVIVETAASGSPSDDTCEVSAADCIDSGAPTYEAKSWLENGGPLWLAGQYYDSDGQIQNLLAGDYISSGYTSNLSYKLYTYNSPGNYTEVVISVYSALKVVNSGEWYFNRGGARDFEQPEISGYTPLTAPPTFYGRASDERTELWLEDAGGAQVFVQTTDATSIDLGEQITHDGYTYLVIKTISLLCGLLHEVKFTIPIDYLVFTNADDDNTLVISNADDDTTLILGGSDIPSVSIP